MATQTKQKNLQVKSKMPTYPMSQEYGTDDSYPLYQSYKDPSGIYHTVNRYNPQMANQNAQAQADVLGGLQGLSPLMGPHGFEAMNNMNQQYSNIYGDLMTSQFLRQLQPQMTAERQQYANNLGGLANTPYVNYLGNLQQQTINPQLANIAEQAQLIAPQITNQQIQDQLNMLGTAQGVTSSNLQQFLSGLQEARQASLQPEQANISTGVYGSPGQNAQPSNLTGFGQGVADAAALAGIVGAFL